MRALSIRAAISAKRAGWSGGRGSTSADSASTSPHAEESRTAFSASGTWAAVRGAARSTKVAYGAQGGPGAFEADRATRDDLGMRQTRQRLGFGECLRTP